MTIKIAKSRIGTDFRVISEDFLIRPASEDFWRLESEDEDNYHVSRVVSSSDDGSVPDIRESLSRIATRVKRIIPLDYSPSEYKSIGISPKDEVLLLDDRGFTYDLGQALGTTKASKVRVQIRERLKELNTVLSEARKLKPRELSDLFDFLAHHGPIELDSRSLIWRKLLNHIMGLTKVTKLSKR